MPLITKIGSDGELRVRYASSRNGWQRALQGTCLLCGTPFVRIAAEAKKTGAKYCSQSCAGKAVGALKYWHKVRDGEIDRRPKPGDIKVGEDGVTRRFYQEKRVAIGGKWYRIEKRTCKNCSKEFYVRSTELARKGKGVFCSRGCGTTWNNNQHPARKVMRRCKAWGCKRIYTVPYGQRNKTATCGRKQCFESYRLRTIRRAQKIRTGVI